MWLTEKPPQAAPRPHIYVVTYVSSLSAHFLADRTAQGTLPLHRSRVSPSLAPDPPSGEGPFLPLLNLIPTESDAFDIHRVEHENALCERLSSGMKVGKGPRIHTAARVLNPVLKKLGAPVPVPAWRPKARIFIPKAR